jgi:hypothetical protein
VHQLALVAFVILMERSDGIVGKSPRDMALAWQACQRCQNLEQLRNLLDHEGRIKLQRWQSRWAQRLRRPPQR